MVENWEGDKVVESGDRLMRGGRSPTDRVNSVVPR